MSRSKKRESQSILTTNYPDTPTIFSPPFLYRYLSQLLQTVLLLVKLQLKHYSSKQDVFISVLPFAFRNISSLDARGEEDRRLYDKRRKGMRNKQLRYTKLGPLISKLVNILKFVIIVDESLASEDIIGFSINAASVGYSLGS
ncbi:MAG: hypothetical protein EZS28_036548 [Streblomastix strix]|uniref:Uncharacterized protein n=1 Tax=Streblomastix strix TaxID=222440 RepID=A0A5J4UE93_9EUKA|nr:MAG: hypothetical protein EZS28_036548 [Streblomastix strix]